VWGYRYTRDIAHAACELSKLIITASMETRNKTCSFSGTEISLAFLVLSPPQNRLQEGYADEVNKKNYNIIDSLFQGVATHRTGVDKTRPIYIIISRF